MNTRTTLFSLLWTCILASTAFAQTEDISIEIPEDALYSEATSTYPLEKLTAEFGRNKKLPEGYELPILLALSHFPELTDTKITFKVRRAIIPLYSVPAPLSLFRKKENRRYKVVMSSRSFKGAAPLLVDNLPLNAQIGIIGHELGHTSDYESRKSTSVMGLAFCLLSGKCRKEFERETDRIAIRHGLGWHRYSHSVAVRTAFAANGFEGDSDSYLSPEEILDVMRELPIYAEYFNATNKQSSS